MVRPLLFLSFLFSLHSLLFAFLTVVEYAHYDTFKELYSCKYRTPHEQSQLASDITCNTPYTPLTSHENKILDTIKKAFLPTTASGGFLHSGTVKEGAMEERKCNIMLASRDSVSAIDE